jgi:hypothetical protein
MTLEKMFEAYANERGVGGPYIYHHSEVGFATYHIHPNSECYIEDIFVIPERRNFKMASFMADEIVKIAKANRCKILTGTIVPSAKSADASRKVLIAYGFKLLDATNEVENYFKEI